MMTPAAGSETRTIGSGRGTSGLRWVFFCLVFLVSCTFGLATGHADNEGDTASADAIESPMADPIHTELREFFPTGKYVLYVSARVQRTARVLHSRRAGAFLIIGSEYGRAILIQPKTKTVSAISEEKIARRPDKGYDVVADATIEELGSFTRKGSDVAIALPGLRARMRPQQHLIGLLSADDLTLHTPEYERNGQTYNPRASDLRKLQQTDKDVVIRVYFGTWCHTCTRLLPRIIKVDKALAGSNVRFEYYGLPKGARAMARDPLVRRNNIKRIPTGIVTIDGRNAGRINSTQFARPEAALAGMVR